MKKRINGWMIAFFGSIALCLILFVFAVYCIVDRGYTVTYGQVAYDDMETTADNLIWIINETDMTQLQIERAFEGKYFYKSESEKDVMYIDFLTLTFRDGKLVYIKK